MSRIIQVIELVAPGTSTTERHKALLSCRACSGVGSRQSQISHGVFIDKKCVVCNGTTYVEAHVTIEFKPFKLIENGDK
ncbi:MAG: hypothetical protein PHV20_12470 [Bacteroidales bacterium]|nr:hypothetical protein [Bacteroidales bacterium]